MNKDWIRVTQDSLPPENTNVLVSDGETITQARYVRSENHINWFMCNPAYNDLKFDWWSPLPQLPPKIIKKVEEVLDKNIKED